MTMVKRDLLTFIRKSTFRHCLYAGITAISISAASPVLGADTDTDRALLRERMLLESVVAMQEPGTKVCREVRWGIGMREWVEGMSLGVRQDTRRVIVHVTRLGQGPFLREGREVKVGENLEENPLDWAPCR